MEAFTPPVRFFTSRLSGKGRGTRAMRSVSRTTMLLALSLASSCGALVMGPSKAAPAMSRRAAVSRTLLGVAGAASSLLPLPSVAVAPPSPQQILKSRAVYGSRIYRLQDATPAVIIDEKNAFTLFITGVFGSTVDKPTKKALEKLETSHPESTEESDAMRQIYRIGRRARR